MLIQFSFRFLTAAFAGQRLLDPSLFPRFQVEGVFLDFLDDVLLLYLAFEPAESVFERFAFLNPHLSHTYPPPSSREVWEFDSGYSRLS